MIADGHDDFDGEDDAPRRGGWTWIVYRWLLGVGGAAALLFGGVYVVYSLGYDFGGRFGGGAQPDVVPLIRAAQEPVRVRPEERGGKTVLHSNLGVYEEIDPAQRGGPACHPLPSLMAATGRLRRAVLEKADPDRAGQDKGGQDRAGAPAAARAGAGAAAGGPPAAAAKPGVFALPAERPRRGAGKAAPAAKAAPAKAAPAAKTVTAAKAVPAAQAAPAAGSDGARAGATPAATSRAPRPTPGTTSQGARPAAGGYRVQLAAFRSPAKAREHGRGLQRRHRTLLGRLTLAVERVDLGSKGIYYRLRAGPLADWQAAQQLCRTLVARRVKCFPVSG